MFYVYLLRSENFPEETYIGFTTDLRARLRAHNAGRARHSAKYRPWRLEAYCAFRTAERAREFERYLKSHSGKAFANKRFWYSPSPNELRLGKPAEW